MRRRRCGQLDAGRKARPMATSVECRPLDPGTEHFTSRKGQSGAFWHSPSFHSLDLSNIRGTCKNTC